MGEDCVMCNLCIGAALLRNLNQPDESFGCKLVAPLEFTPAEAPPYGVYRDTEPHCGFTHYL